MLLSLLCFFVSGTSTQVEPIQWSTGEMTLGITLSCPYGLGVCYPEIHTALTRIPGLETISETADPNSWTCRIHMAKNKILRPYELDAYLRSLHAGATLRGIEATVEGHLEGREGTYSIVSGSSRLPLEGLRDTVYWDARNKRPKPLSSADRQAYADLVQSIQVGSTVRVTGVLRDQSETDIPALEVRSFVRINLDKAGSHPDEATDGLIADLPIPVELQENPPANPISRLATSDPSVIGSWGPVHPAPKAAVHAHLNPNGKVMFNGLDAEMHTFGADGVLGTAQTAPYNVFCGGHAFAADGKLFISGGNGPQITDGDDRATIYDSVSDKWTVLPSSGMLRWYPTVVQMPGKQMLTLGGSCPSDQHLGDIPQIWNGVEWINLTGARRKVPQYAQAYVGPDSRVFVAGPDQVSLYLDTMGIGHWSTGPTRTFAARDYGCSVMYLPGKVFYVGGGNPPTPTSESIDLNSANPAWQAMAAMHFARRQCNATLLPDGTILVNGGTNSAKFDDPANPVNQSEIWNPTTNTWTLAAPQKVYRGYHSTSILMPNGKVFSCGGTASVNVEVFAPPYLFKGPRPVVLAAPKQIIGGQQFSVICPDTTKIRKVSLISLGSATHAGNRTQRFQWLSFSANKGSLTITAPTVTPMNPAGCYLLFVLNDKGVPSVAKFVQLQPSHALQPESPI